MDETTDQTTPTVVEGVPVETNLNWLQRQVMNHPRASRAVAVIGAAGTAVGGALFVATLRSNKDHLDSALDHAKEAGSELSASVTPGDTEA